MRNYCKMAIALSWVALAAGCQPPPASQTTPRTDASDQPASPTAAADADRSVTRDTPEPRASTVAKPSGTDADQQSSLKYDPDTGDVSVNEPAQDTRKKAQGGVGKRGQGYGGGAVSEPARQYFQIRERIVFQVQVPQALNTYKALDPQGKGPQTHDEFMEKVIRANGLTLPELPPGIEYQYDPETEELMVQGTRR